MGGTELCRMGLIPPLRDELGMSNEEIGKAGFDLDEFYEVEAADSAEYEVEADYGEEL